MTHTWNAGGPPACLPACLPAPTHGVMHPPVPRQNLLAGEIPAQKLLDFFGKACYSTPCSWGRLAQR